MPNIDVQEYTSLESVPESEFDIYYKFSEKKLKILQYKDEVPYEYLIFFKDDIINIYKGVPQEDKTHKLNIVHKNHKTIYIINLDTKQFCNLFELFFDWLESDVWISKAKSVNKL